MSTPNDNKPTKEAIAADRAALAHYKATHAAALPEEDEQPSPAAVEQALAQEKANNEKIDATVQAAKGEMQCQLVERTLYDHVKQERDALQAARAGSVEAQAHFGLRVGHYASLLYACEVGSESAAREVEKLILERDTLQAQRDELLVACKGLLQAYAWNADKTAQEQGEGALQSDVQRARVAIARATEGGTGQ